MISISRKLILGLTLFASFIPPATAGSGWIAVFQGDAEAGLHEASVPVWGREEGIVIAGPSDEQLAALHAQGIEPLFRSADKDEGIHVVSHDSYFIPASIPGLTRFQINDHAVLYLIPESTRVNLPRVRLHTLAHGIPRVALP